jgi:chromosome segregation ATPase
VISSQLEFDIPAKSIGSMSTPNKSSKQKQKDLAVAPTTSSKPAPSSEGLAEQVKTFVSIGQQLLQNHAKELYDIDALKREHMALQEQVSKQNQEIAVLKHSNLVLGTTFSEQEKNWKVEKECIENQLNSGKKKHEELYEGKVQDAQRRMHFAESKAREMKKTLGEAQQQLNAAETTRIGFEKQLGDCRLELDRLRIDVGIEVFVGNMFVV